MGTDKYAYASRLRETDPRAKLLLLALTAAVCIAAGSIPVSLMTLLLMCAATVCLGGIGLRVLLRIMRLPLGFILVGALTLAVGRYEPEADILWGIAVSNARYGVTAASLWYSAVVLARAMGVVAALYFFSLNTTVTDFCWALETLRIPRLFAEMMELIYRYIFLLSDTAEKIKTAQAARLGYARLKLSYKSTGTLAASVFLRAYRKSGRAYEALESRGYTGELRMLAPALKSGRDIYILCAAIPAAQLGTLVLERVVRSWGTW